MLALFCQSAHLAEKMEMPSQVLLVSTVMLKLKGGRKLYMLFIPREEECIFKYITEAELFTQVTVMEPHQSHLHPLVLLAQFTLRMEKNIMLPQEKQLKKISKESSKLLERVLRTPRKQALTAFSCRLPMDTSLINS
jgi:hypothetical protein